MPWVAFRGCVGCIEIVNRVVTELKAIEYDSCKYGNEPFGSV